MQGEVAYRQLVLSDQRAERLRLPLLAPVNDMLGWANAKGYGTYLFQRYGPLGFPKGSIGNSVTEAGAFFSAAQRATKGHIAASVAEHIERLRFAADGTVDDVPDFAALAAWSLVEGVRRQQLKMYTCPTCKRRWLGVMDESSRYCQRRAPGHPSKDCRTLAYERRIAGDDAYQAYRREYKRITEAERRGAIDLVDVYRWREDNDATSWHPFEQWKATKEHNDG